MSATRLVTGKVRDRRHTPTRNGVEVAYIVTVTRPRADRGMKRANTLVAGGEFQTAVPFGAGQAPRHHADRPGQDHIVGEPW